MRPAFVYLRTFIIASAVATIGFAFGSPALALDPSQALDRYVYQAWTTDDGLPQNSVYAIAQTRDGYLWLGTDEGLVRFDGLRFTVFDRTNTPAIADPFVFALHEARDGSLWAGTDRGGVIRLRDGRFTRYAREHGLPSARVQAIASDAAGTVWVGLRGAGVARLAGDRFEVLGRDAGLASDNVLALQIDRAGTLWVGTDAGLDRLDGHRFVRVDGVPAGAVRAIHEDKAGRLWIGTIDGALGARVRAGALAVRTDTRIDVVAPRADLPSLAVMAIEEDRDGSLWLGTAGGGIVRVRDGRFESWLLSDSPSDDMVYALAEDAEGNLWAGTQPGGLHRLRNSRFLTYEKRDGLGDEVIESLLEDHRGVMWVGTHAGGACAIERGGPRCLTVGDGLAHARVNAMAEDADGTMWFGTEGGLNRLRGGSMVRFSSRDGLPIDHVNALLRDRAGRLWVGTWGGGVVVSSGARFARPPGESGRYVTTFHQRRSGEVWIGTTEGLAIWTGDRLVNATAERGLPAAIEAIHEDRDGYLWIGTRRDGLFLLKDGRLTQYTTGAGLYDNLVGTLLEDASGHFWITCNKGIFRVSRQALLDVAAGRAAAVTSRVFDTADGLKNRECNFGQGRWIGRDGRLWFATVGGVAVIDPARLAGNSEPARMRIGPLIVDGDEVATEPPPTLGSGARRVEFHFVGLSLSAPSRVRYRYRLEGFDPRWIDGGESRTAHYTNIPPGTYRFHVVASNGDGVWSPDVAPLQVAVAAPIWRRPWFVLSAFGLVIASVIAVDQVRVARLRRAQAVQAEFSRQLISSQENERKRLAGDLHDGIGQQLLIIANWARLALTAPAAADQPRSSLQMITDAASDSIREIRALTRELQPYNIEHVGLRDALETMLHRLGDASGVTFTADIEPVDGLLPADGGINLYRIVQEAANNVVKHAQASQARVTIRRRGPVIHVSIADDGRGLPAGAATAGSDGGGFGLRSIAARARLVGGRHHVASAPEAGTTITVEIPIPSSQDTDAR